MFTNVDELWDAMEKHNIDVKYYNDNPKKRTEKVIAFLKKRADILRYEFDDLDAGYAGGDVWYTFEINDDFSVYTKKHIKEDMKIYSLKPDGTVNVYKMNKKEK